jgi:alkyl sulfatase BDS1-like metallo-beta-lactamase superfamily hydrolase
LARWGTRVPLDAASTPDLSVDALVFALKTTFDAEVAGTLRTTCQLRLGDDRFHAEVADGRFRVARGEIHDADITITTTASDLQSLVFGDRPLADAERAGGATVEGNHQAAEHLLRCFPRTVPVTPALSP